MNRKKIFIAAIFLTVVVAGSFYLTNASAQKSDEAPVKAVYNVAVTSSDGINHDFKVELAITQEQREQGLMYRTEMAEDAGMIFVFDDEAQRAFYMKNTYIPLDMLFIKRDGTIGYIYENAKPNDLSLILSNGTAYAVIELNGGIAKKLKIKAGDIVHGEFFKNDIK